MREDLKQAQKKLSVKKYLLIIILFNVKFVFLLVVKPIFNSKHPK